MNSIATKFTRQSASIALGFGWLVPSKQWFKLGEIAKIIGMGKTFVENLYDEGRLLSGHTHNAGTGQRRTRRVPRAFVVALVVKTAGYDAETKLQAFTSCLSEFTAAQLRQIAALAECLSAKKGRERA